MPACGVVASVGQAAQVAFPACPGQPPRLASSDAPPAAARQAAAVLADTDSPYDLHGLADAASEAEARLHQAVRDAVAGVPGQIPGS